MGRGRKEVVSLDARRIDRSRRRYRVARDELWL